MIYVLPQCPFKNRYTEDWIVMWKREMDKLGIDYTIIGSEMPIDSDNKLFTNMETAIGYELDQYLTLLDYDYVKNINEILFLDVDFPGFSPVLIQLLKHINPKLKAYGYLHAGSWCNKDIFSNEKGKKELELASFKLFDKLFVATEYHKRKINSYFQNEFDNIYVVGLPFYKEDVLQKVERVKTWGEKEFIFISGREVQSNSRNRKNFIGWLKKNCSGLQIKTYDDIHSRQEYFDILNNSKISISFKVEETFGLSQLESYVLNCIPISPNNYSYPEIFPERFLYNEELYLNVSVFFKKIFGGDLYMKENEIDFEKYEDSIKKIFNLIQC